MYKQEEAVQKLEAFPKWYVLLSFLLPRAKPCSGEAWGIITAEACRLKSLTSRDKISWNLIHDPSNYLWVATGHSAARRLLWDVFFAKENLSSCPFYLMLSHFYTFINFTQGTCKFGLATHLPLPHIEGAVAPVTGSISFMVKRVFLRAPYYSIETKRGVLDERLFIIGKVTDNCEVFY